jgi:hypothetical protein
MDSELKNKTQSRNLDTLDEEGKNTGDEEIAESAHVLDNLLQSLEASAGTAGPVPNMLNEMRAEPPK